jgi:quinol monooxygenase YgiN
MMAAAIFEARMSRAQAERLAEVIREAKPRRPDGVLEVRLYVEGDVATLVSLWRDRDTLETYLADVDVPRGTELMREVGAEPSVRIADVFERS